MRSILLNFIFNLLFYKIFAANFTYFMNKDACDSEYGCLLHPEGCDPLANCTVALTFRKITDDAVEFSVAASYPGRITDYNRRYVAIGFSDDQEMGNDAATVCVPFLNKEMELFLAYNPSTINLRIRDNQLRREMLKLIDMHVANEDVDSHVYCRFQQKLRPDVTNQRVYNLAEPYYLLVATGSADFRTLEVQAHVLNRWSPWFPVISKEKIQVTQIVATPSPAPIEERVEVEKPVASVNDTAVSSAMRLQHLQIVPQTLIFVMILICIYCALS